MAKYVYIHKIQHIILVLFLLIHSITHIELMGYYDIICLIMREVIFMFGTYFSD